MKLTEFCINQLIIHIDRHPDNHVVRYNENITSTKKVCELLKCALYELKNVRTKTLS